MILYDQIFAPGDKVVVIAFDTLARQDAMCVEVPENLSKHRTYCVEKCWRAKWGGHEITLIGVANPIDDQGEKGWGACFFRRVDEVRQILAFFKGAEIIDEETAPAQKPETIQA